MAIAPKASSSPQPATPILRDAILRKCRESMATKEKFLTEQAERVVECGTAVAKAFDAGGRLFVIGNGGSSCDAAHVATMLPEED
ncbi:MAG TPA: hypothetical protein VJ739_16270 [Gemmataceae bacterium]|nr:hypothetical protein [Gemmataceae bacterium]